MELVSLLLLVLIPPADFAKESSSALQAALYQELGAVSIAIVVDTPEANALWRGEGGRVRAQYVSRLHWETAQKIHVQLFSGASQDRQPLSVGARTIVFLEADSHFERGRTLGLVIAQLFREQASLRSEVVPPKALTLSPTQSEHAIEVSMDLESYGRSNVAIGPAIFVRAEMKDWLWVHGCGHLYQGFFHGYSELGLGAGVTWPALRLPSSRFIVGPRLEIGAHREGVHPGEEHTRGKLNIWSWSLGTRLEIMAKLWKSLRGMAGIGVRAQTARLDYSTGELEVKESKFPTNYQTPRVRLYASIGVSAAF